MITSNPNFQNWSANETTEGSYPVFRCILIRIPRGIIAKRILNIATCKTLSPFLKNVGIWRLQSFRASVIWTFRICLVCVHFLHLSCVVFLYSGQNLSWNILCFKFESIIEFMIDCKVLAWHWLRGGPYCLYMV